MREARALDPTLEVGAHRVLRTGVEAVVLLLHHQVGDRHELVDVVVGKVDVVRDKPRQLPDGPIACLNDSFGFGGHDVVLVFKTL